MGSTRRHSLIPRCGPPTSVNVEDKRVGLGLNPTMRLEEPRVHLIPAGAREPLLRGMCG